VSWPTFRAMLKLYAPSVKPQKKTKDMCNTCSKYFHKRLAYEKAAALTRDKESEEWKGKEKAFGDVKREWEAHLHHANCETRHYREMSREAQRDAVQRRLWAERQVSGRGNNDVDNIEDLTIHLAVDMMRTLKMPHLKRQANKLYYHRGVKLYTLGIWDEGMKKGDVYTWDETKGAATSEHVIQALEQWRKTHHQGEGTLRLTFDNCSVNKSNLVLAYCCHLVAAGHFKHVYVDFQVAGHTKFAPDRVFAWLSHLWERNDVPNTERWRVLASNLRTVDAEALDKVKRNGDWLLTKYRKTKGIKLGHTFHIFRGDGDTPDKYLCMTRRERSSDDESGAETTHPCRVAAVPVGTDATYSDLTLPLDVYKELWEAQQVSMTSNSDDDVAYAAEYPARRQQYIARAKSLVEGLPRDAAGRVMPPDYSTFTMATLEKCFQLFGKHARGKVADAQRSLTNLVVELARQGGVEFSGASPAALEQQERAPM